MNVIFFLAAAVAIFSTIMVITRLNAVHALLYLIVSLLSVAVIFYLMGAPFMAALEVIIYAGAIMVLFIFVVMMLNLGKESEKAESELLNRKMWIGPSILAGILLVEMLFIFSIGTDSGSAATVVSPRQVGTALFGPYLLAVEMAGMLLMGGIIGAFHLGRRAKKVRHRFLKGGSP